MPKTLLPLPKRSAKILRLLERAYPDATCALIYQNPLELMVATILSAQCTDVLVNKVTPELFKRYKTARDYAKAPLERLERDLSRVNFYRNKAKSIKAACQLLVDEYGGKVPKTMEKLIKLPGVGRKTANVILGNAFNIQAGIVVDTHMIRLTQRMGLSRQKDRDKIEQELLPLVPKENWTRFSHVMIQHGRSLCKAPKPLCPRCPLDQSLCPARQA